MEHDRHGAHSLKMAAVAHDDGFVATVARVTFSYFSHSKHRWSAPGERVQAAAALRSRAHDADASRPVPVPVFLRRRRTT